mmetsp:Transcript_11920/g.17205  ORF Transcript_11920/g.17205 Transcript_11920/m.17205 type:complete len:385 (+) Transcript_11920:51-1205(+)
MKIPHRLPAIKPRFSGNIILLVGLCTYIVVRYVPLLIIMVTFILQILIPYCFCEGDNAVERRMMWTDFLNEAKSNPEYEDIKEIIFPNPSEVQLEEAYWVNSRGMVLMTSIMRPANREVKAVACCCHGYSDLTSFLLRYEYQRLVREGIAVISMDYEGHGRSDGEFCYIPNWNHVIEDVAFYFRETSQREFPGKKCFLVGESMGGAVAFDVYSRIRSVISGVVLIAPMAKINEEMMPHPIIIKLLHWIIGSQGTERLIGIFPLAPSTDLSTMAYSLDVKRRLAHCIPIIYSRKPRLTTARELLLTAQRISNSLKQFDAPFLVLHGLDDKVTDPKLSQALYDESRSFDKHIQLYEGMSHTITSGEPEKNLDIVFNDIITWIEARL